MRIAVDNDIVLKGVCFGILVDIFRAFDCEAEAIGALGVARFVLRRRVAKANVSGDRGAVLKRLEGFFASATLLEPTDEEERLAARLEGSAQRLGVSLDAGESQLCAAALVREIPLLLTGDKRAIAAMERLLDHEARMLRLCGKVRCLEQCVALVLDRVGADVLRGAICSERAVDRCLTICFACSSAAVERASVVEGLTSYIESLRTDASRVLGR